ncbi:MAG: hypothetical protein E7274_02435 [Pseudobutyrivibrio ruminis]|uniref:hypothetical protein n=1 Tax=Pseudobutyrivibrio ruminis TaxID=46206 RepID=UPI0026EDBE42|nr:hypothetical protein [Pseudobutyrivibrio ruminis]MBE5912900.1 hypothetical protein [Pseudobutyrivibrio ruminis]
MIQSFLLPLLYSIVIGVCWSEFFKRKFLDSLAPAFIFHTLLVIVCGLIFENLLVGLFLGLIVAVSIIGYLLIKNIHEINKITVAIHVEKWISEGLLVFIAFYILCFILNFGKRYVEWDEFSHWGMFLKESMRLDKLYCTSNLTFAHKDYVPALTIFEYIYCKVAGGLTEPESYRAVQIFGFALIMPMFNMVMENLKVKKSFANIIITVMAVLVPLLLPFIFNQGAGFKFYHTVYCDYTLGLFLAYLCFEAYKTYNDFSYQSFILTIGFMGFILSKMTSIALYPMVLVLLIATRVSTHKFEKRDIVKYAVMMGLPLIIWLWFNQYVKGYVDINNSAQSYGNMNISMLKDVFGFSSESSISYIGELRYKYFMALFTQNILVNGSYLCVLMLIVIAVLGIWYYSVDEEKKKKVLISSLWIALFGLIYAIFMYFLYAVCFSQYEATSLASYERYMNSFMLAAIMFVVYLYYDSNLWKSNKRLFQKLFMVLVVYIFIFNIETIYQVLPGIVTGDSNVNQEYISNANIIVSNTAENSRIFAMKRGDNGFVKFVETYYCGGRQVDGYSVGTPLNDGDIWTQDITSEEFVDVISDYDYIYFYAIDEDFLNRYSDAFVNPELIMNSVAYKVRVDNGKINLE